MIIFNIKSGNLFPKMKKTVLSLLIFLIVGQIDAQIAYWIIHPDYDSIYFASGANLVITDSLNEKIVWTPDGKRLFKTADKLHQFAEGIAVTTKQNSRKITGFYTTDGKFTPIENCIVAHDFPYFSDGYLLVVKQNRYYFVDTDGRMDERGFDLAYPFHHGFASCCDHIRSGKSIICNSLINKNKQELSFSFKGKRFSRNALDFVSSVNGIGIGIVVARGKAYYFTGEKELEPIFQTADKNKLKNQAKLDGKISDCLVEWGNSDFILYMNYRTLSCRFDARMIPLEIGPNLNRIPFETISATKVEKTSPLAVTEKDQLYGLSINGIQILPEQFEAIYKCFGDDVFVRKSGKQGLLHVSKDESFLPIINNGQDVCFRHRTTNAKIHLDIPDFIPSEKTYIMSLDSSCFVERRSRVNKKTPKVSYVEYDCTLSFPDVLYNYSFSSPNNLTDETIPIIYPIRITSDGIEFPKTQLEANVWHDKYFTIDIKEKERIALNNIVTLSIDIISEEGLSNEEMSPYKVTIETSDYSLNYECKSFLSNKYHYECTLYNLKKGQNDIIIRVVEEGCPPVSCPYSIIYSKPSAKNKAKKEDAEVKKKTKINKVGKEVDDEIVPGL